MASGDKVERFQSNGNNIFLQNGILKIESNAHFHNQKMCFVNNVFFTGFLIGPTQIIFKGNSKTTCWLFERSIDDIYIYFLTKSNSCFFETKGEVNRNMFFRAGLLLISGFPKNKVWNIMIIVRDKASSWSILM